MEVYHAGDYTFIRLEPGEPVIHSLKEVARDHEIRVGAITSGVGMLARAKLGFFCIPMDDYQIHEIDEIMDLSSIEGNITWRNENPVPHVHMTMNKPDYTTISGHIIEAWCHITMEIFVRRLSGANLVRAKVPGVPATRITRQENG